MLRTIIFVAVCTLTTIASAVPAGVWCRFVFSSDMPSSQKRTSNVKIYHCAQPQRFSKIFLTGLKSTFSVLASYSTPS